MDTNLIQFSIVLVGTGFNPQSFNPDFFATKGIVEPDWKLYVTQHSNNSLVSLTEYNQNLQIIVERSKLQVAFMVPKEVLSIQESKVQLIVNNFIKALPYISFSSIGINFHVVIEKDNPKTFMIEHFLKPNSGTNKTYPLFAASINLIYEIPNGFLTFNVDSGEAEKVEDEKTPILLIKTNSHRNLSGPAPGELLAEIIGNVEKDWLTVSSVLSDILESEEKSNE